MAIRGFASWRWFIPSLLLPALFIPSLVAPESVPIEEAYEQIQLGMSCEEASALMAPYEEMPSLKLFRCHWTDRRKSVTLMFAPDGSRKEGDVTIYYGGRVRSKTIEEDHRPRPAWYDWFQVWFQQFGP